MMPAAQLDLFHPADPARIATDIPRDIPQDTPPSSSPPSPTDDPGTPTGTPSETSPLPLRPPPPPAWSSKADLIRRGWTAEAIAAYLGPPDRKETRQGTMGVEAHLYAGARVEAAEATEAFRRWKSVTEAGRTRRAEAKRRAEAETLAHMERWQPRLRVLPLEELRSLSIATHNAYLDRRALRAALRDGDVDDSPRASENSDARFLDRIMVNFIRHRLTGYDAAARTCRSHPAALAILRQRVFAAIATAYPSLAAEAQRQLSVRKR